MEINGYVSQPEPKNDYPCVGCAFHEPDSYTTCVASAVGCGSVSDSCYEYSIIWVKKEDQETESQHTCTEKEVLDFLVSEKICVKGSVMYQVVSQAFESITMKKSAEYQEYLRLKAKFEQN
jgi:hypothetical protein